MSWFTPFRSLLLCLLFLSLSCEACQLHQVQAEGRGATFQVLSGENMATAWAVSPHYLVTAGHMCECFSPAYVLLQDYRRYHALAVYWEKSEDGTHDVCILKTDTALRDWLTLSDRMPRIGEPVAYTGYPLGEYKEANGVYLGDLDGPATMNDAVFTAPCDHGASGSAVYTYRGVWGILVRIRTDGGYIHPGEHGCVAIPLDILRKALDTAGADYTVVGESPVI